MAKGDRPSDSIRAINIRGVSVDLPSALKYSPRDSSISTAVRAAIDAFENKRYTAKVEFGRLIAQDGAVLFDSKRGSHGAVKFDGYYFRVAQVMTHNHPRDTQSGLLGGTFSYDDVYNFTAYAPSNAIHRATAAEGTYSIRKLKGFKQSFAQAYKSHTDAASRTAQNKHNSLVNAYHDGRISYDDYLKANRQANNEMFISLHNWLRQNQRKYGYKYGLERR